MPDFETHPIGAAAEPDLLQAERDDALAAKDARIAVLEEALIRISIEAKGTGIPNESLHVVRTVAIAALEGEE